MSEGSLNIEKAVMERYTAGARKPEKALCCPTKFDSDLLSAIPREILDRDYGCGDPTPYVRPGDTVLDLGSGAGKNCFLAAQLAGRDGRVIGVDMNDEMLGLARKHRRQVGDRLGYQNVEFRKGQIQDLRLDQERLDGYLKKNPVNGLADLARLEEFRIGICREHPLIPDNSIDCILSNCVLNLVRKTDRQQLLQEMYRVLKPGGRVAISDIVAEKPVPEKLMEDSGLWTSCISGAFQEEEFLNAFETAGFYGMEIAAWGDDPYAVVEGLEFRSVTITARKGKEGPCPDRGHTVVYRGPWSAVQDDDGHRLVRGVRTAVCDKTFRIFGKGPYRDDLILLEPKNPDAKESPRDGKTSCC
ncbi:MAG: methyltransferase domain-containing protein [Acidobacteriota bacterium]